jgi:diacylglycerol kinase (ATP)
MSDEQPEKPTGIRRLLLAAQNSGRAFHWMLKHEAAFQQELLLLAGTILICFVWDISLLEKLFLLLSILVVMLTEVLNTAIEVTIDRIGLERHELSGLAKDMGSAAVLIAMIMAALIWATVIYLNV